MEADINVPVFKLLQAVVCGLQLSEPQLKLLQLYAFVTDVDGVLTLTEAGVSYLKGISPRLMREPIIKSKSKFVKPQPKDLSASTSSNANTMSTRAAILELANSDCATGVALKGFLFEGSTSNAINDRTMRVLIGVFKRAWATGRRSGMQYAFEKLNYGKGITTRPAYVAAQASLNKRLRELAVDLDAAPMQVVTIKYDPSKDTK